MKKSAPGKLVVRGETLRALGSLELRDAVGGLDTTPAACVVRRFDSDPAACTTRVVKMAPSLARDACDVGD